MIELFNIAFSANNSMFMWTHWYWRDTCTRPNTSTNHNWITRQYACSFIGTIFRDFVYSLQSDPWCKVSNITSIAIYNITSIARLIYLILSIRDKKALHSLEMFSLKVDDNRSMSCSWLHSTSSLYSNTRLFLHSTM